MGSWDNACSHAALPMGQARAGRPGEVYRVDERQPASSAGLPRAANRQRGVRKGRRGKFPLFEGTVREVEAGRFQIDAFTTGRDGGREWVC